MWAQRTPYLRDVWHLSPRLLCVRQVPVVGPSPWDEFFETTVPSERLQQFMLRLAKAGAPLRGLWKQLAFLVAEVLERKIIAGMDGAQGSNPTGVQLAEVDADRIVLQYWFAGRKELSEAQYLGFSCDYSRVSRRPTSNGLLTKGNLAVGPATGDLVVGSHVSRAMQRRGEGCMWRAAELFCLRVVVGGLKGVWVWDVGVLFGVWAGIVPHERGLPPARGI